MQLLSRYVSALPDDEAARLRAEWRASQTGWHPDPELAHLEALVGRRRQLASISLALDGYNRWRNKSDPAFHADATRQLAELDAVTEELEALSRWVRTEAPAAFARWTDAHIALLEDFIARSDDSTAIYVAGEEIDAWREVSAGTRDRVEQNVYYVRPNAETYRRLFDAPEAEPLPSG